MGGELGDVGELGRDEHALTGGPQGPTSHERDGGDRAIGNNPVIGGGRNNILFHYGVGVAGAVVIQVNNVTLGNFVDFQEGETVLTFPRFASTVRGDKHVTQATWRNTVGVERSALIKCANHIVIVE